MSEILTGPIIKPNSGKITNAIIFLHGYGANGDDLIGIGNEWKAEIEDTVFISPNAPFTCEWSKNAYQWFDLTSIAPEKIGEGLETSGPFLHSFIDDVLLKYNLDEGKIFFVGFSQGTMMALFHLCKRRSSCAGLLGYSGLLYENKKFDDEVLSKFPIRLYHGLNDEVINSEFTSKASEKLKSLGFNVDYHLQNELGHGIDGFGLNFGLEFAKKTLIV